MLLQVCASIANLPERPECYYISGEEAADQVKIRARRLGLETAPVNLRWNKYWLLITSFGAPFAFAVFAGSGD